MTKNPHLILALLAVVIGCAKPQPEHGLSEHGQPEHSQPEYILPERDPSEVQSGLPRLGVFTGSPIDSKTRYVDAHFLLEDSQFKGKIRGRGNYTWELYPKKPYRIKLDKEESLLGMNASREWVLLADYRDPSLMRTSYLMELANQAGMQFTSTYKHLELYLNGEFQGVYILVEPVQSAVKIGRDGFIIEEDTYWADEPVWLLSGQGRHYTFKYPDNPDAEAKRFISGVIGKVEDGDTDVLDLVSFARWYIVNELLGNYDPNMYYVLPSRGEKLMMCPVWDAEGSLGVMGRKPEDPVPSPGSVATGFSICTYLGYFRQLLENPTFISTLEEEWRALKPLLPSFREEMRATATMLKEARRANWTRWPVNDTCEGDVAFIEDYFARRIRWLDYYIGFLTSSTEPVPLEEVSPDYSEPDAIDLGLSVLWASRNLGARSEYDSGCNFAWGETEPKADYTWSSYAYGDGVQFSKYGPDGLVELEPADDPARVHLGGGWRLPTRWELWELWDFIYSNSGKMSFETEGGVNGFRIEAPSGASVFFPFAGRASGSAIEDIGRYAYYWTSSLTRSTSGVPAGAYFLGVEGTTESVNQWSCGRYYGLPVRPVKER